MVARPKFVHLRVHSAYSLLEGALPIGRLAKLAQADGMPALGLTDTNNLFGALEFSEKLAGAGVQPIVGAQLSVDFEDRVVDPVAGLRGAPGGGAVVPAGVVALYAMNDVGYANLIKLASFAFLDTDPHDPPHVRFSALEAHADGLIALTGGPDGPVSEALTNGQVDTARNRLVSLQRVFGNRLYVELQRHGIDAEREIEPALVDLAYELELPLVATNDVYFATPDDYEAHDALLCIAEGRTVVEDDRRQVSQQHYFRSADEMAQVFSDLPEALENSVEIAKRCAYRPRGRKPILPRFVQSDEHASNEDQLAAEAAELKRQAEEGLARRLAVQQPADGYSESDYWQRLSYELGIIERMKFPGYFLIVADFIKWAKAHGIPVGPGRGSGAGSAVAWALTITDLDPLRFGLLFERFLNPERVSMPDFDIDFCQDRREEVIKYVQQKYGEDRVAQIITHGKLQARAVLRDVGRVLQIPYGQVDRLAKLVPNNPANPVTLVEAIASEPKLDEEAKADPLVSRLLEIATKLEGLYRHASTHAAGMVIGDRPLDELVPLYRDPKSPTPVTQFNWKLVEAAGLVKFDFLGLKTLTVLQKAAELVRAGRGIDVDYPALPLTDEKTFQLLERADTAGVFQLESTGMRESLKRLRPDRFEDIIAMVALYRPGPMDNIPTYINRKHGEEPVDCLHEMLEGILKETYGVIIYQEQVIQIAQVMGGYSLGQADLLRRAMGKKDKAEMARQQARFVEGAVENGVKKDDAVYIFELVNKFAGYGFNKSHAAAYALVSYHTAYMKANFREEFIAASMTLDAANTDKLAMFAAEAEKSGIAVLPPCVNASGVEFHAEAPGPNQEHGAIRYALSALKNIGASAVETIVAGRDKAGAYKSLADFAARLDVRAVNKRALETLAAAGAFDGLEANRALVKGNVDGLVAMANRETENAALGTSDLFGGDADGGGPRLDLKPLQGWTPMERLQEEFDSLGFFLSGHPLDQYSKVLSKLGAMRYVDFERATERGVSAGTLAGIVISARERRSAKGNKFAFAMFSDTSGQFEAVIFSDTLAQARDILVAGTPVLLNVEAERDGDAVKMRVQSVVGLDEAARNVEQGLMLVVDPITAAKNARFAEELQRYLQVGAAGQRGGQVRLRFYISETAREVEVTMPGRYDVSPNVAGRLSTLPGILEVLEA